MKRIFRKAVWISLVLMVLSAGPARASDCIIVFNEIMYHPAADQNIEWIELRNLLSIDVDISKWSLRDGIKYAFSEGTIIAAHDYIVVTDSPAVLKQLINPALVYGPFTGSLSNGGERVALYNNGDRLMDAVDYSDGGDWPVAPDGSGVTLAKRRSTGASHPPDNWTWSAQYGGTPGKPNFPGDDVRPVKYNLIGLNGVWRYDDSGANRGTLWRYTGYNDSTWSVGPAGFYSRQPVAGDTPTAIATLYSTGCSDSRQVLSPGQPDPHYFITAASTPAAVMLNHPAWLANDSISMWIGLSAQGTDSQPAGDYSFSTTFDMSGLLADTAELKFTVAVDNDLLDVTINGVSTGISAGPDAFTSFRGPFTIDTGFVSGINQLDFLFRNGGPGDNPMGLRINISGTACPLIGSTLVTEGPVTHYFRKLFPYNGDLQSAISLELNHIVDDGAVFYLNGKEFYRHNMPQTTVDYMTPALSDIDQPVMSGPVSIPITNMTAGNNMLAVEVHQSTQDKDVLFATTVDAAESAYPTVEPTKVSFNTITSALSQQFWLELTNYGDSPVSLTGCTLVCAGTATGQYVIPLHSLAEGESLFIDDAMLGFRPADEDRLFLYSSDGNAVLDAAVVKNSTRARYPRGAGRWQYPYNPVPGVENEFRFNEDIVINEIMYNRCFVPPREAQYATESILQSGAAAKTCVPTDNTYGMNWTGANEPFDDSEWQSGTGATTGIGYERAGGNDYDQWIGTDVEAQMYNKNRSVYVRIPFQVSALDAVDQLELRMIYDDAFIAYLNGREVARSDHVPAVISWNAGADDGHEAAGFESFDITNHKDALVEGRNVLAIHGFNYQLGSSDMIILPELAINRLTLPAVEGGKSSEEWIELYNKGDATVDMSGWKLEDAIDFEFEQGTAIDPDEYIVVARNAAQLATKYPDARIVGQYDGGLSDKTNRIALIDNDKNIADEVTYYDDKPWPPDADGHYASLELRQPGADNSKPAAWAAGDESDRTSWKTYTYRAAAAASPVGASADSQWREFVLGLLDAGEILLDDISVIADPDGSAVQLIQNGTFDSGAAQTWRIIGNHRHSEVITDPDDPGNFVLRFVATGTTGHMHNHAETTLAGGSSVVNGRQYKVSFRAKWISGSNQLNSRLYFNRVPRTTLIDTPQISGTCGAQNSRYEMNIGPTFSNLRHDPPVPFDNEPVTVSVAADDPDGVAGLTLLWRIDGAGWGNLPMSPGSGGTYKAQLPGLGSSTVVQFYVQATDALGATSLFPPQGPDSRALYKVDDGLAATNGLNNFRIIMLSDDYTWMHANINLMSDDRLGATVIYNESEVFYDTGVRLKSSQRHRFVPQHVGFNVLFPADNLFCGIHDTVAIDRSEGVEQGQREMLINITMNRAGACQLSKYGDLVKVIAPALEHTGSAELQMARYNSLFLDNQFANGGDGEVFEFEYVYYPYTTVSGLPDDYKLPVPDRVDGGTIRDYGDDKENYRWQFLKKNNRDEDDYQGLMDFAKDFGTTGSTFNNRVSDIIDVDQWLAAFAIAVACGAGDSYGGDNAQHNMQIYIRPDGRALYFPHDLDAFHSTTRLLIANSDLSKIIATTAYERLYYGHVYNVLQTSYNTTYMKHWTDQLGQLLPAQAFSSHLSFIGDRYSYLSNELAIRIAPAYPFEITQYNSTVADSYATVSGKAWIDVKHVYLRGSLRPLELSWTSTGSGTSKVFYWSTAVPLEPGQNTLILDACDFQNNLIVSRTISITSTVADRPLRDHLRVTEVMYDPIGGSDYEFIELYNSSSDILDLNGLKMVQNEQILFDFSGSAVTSLPPDDYVVIVNNLAAFASRYGASGINIAGEYSNNLSNSGEELTFTGMWDSPVLSFEYSDGRGWPLAADGAGHSLVLLDWVIAAGDMELLEYGGNWRSSTFINGSPGRSDPDLPAGLVLNEIMAHTDYSNPVLPEYDSNDWIELFNPTASTINMTEGQWFLSDDADNLKKWAIPQTSLAPGDRISFDEVTGFHTPITQGFGLDKAGEQLYLSYLPGASDDRVVDCVRFKAQLNDISFGRSPDGGDYWYNMPPSRDAANDNPLGRIVISELMYCPPDAELEYIELYNPSEYPVSLWDAESNTGWRLDGGIEYVFSPDAAIAPFGHLVLVPFEPNELNLTRFSSAYGDQPIEVLGPCNGRLSDRGERIALESPQAPDVAGQSLPWAIVDEVIYFHKAPWPEGVAAAGRALWRIDLNANGNNPAAWSVSAPNPGTMVCDFDHDGGVNLADWAFMAKYWMMEASDPGWNPAADLNGARSDTIDWTDVAIFLQQWLWTSP